MNNIPQINPTEITFRNNGLSPNSQNSYKIAVRQFYSFLQINSLRIGPEALLKYSQEVANRYRATTYNLKMQALKEHLLAQAGADLAQQYAIEKIFQYKIRRVNIKTSVARTRYISREKMESVTDALIAHHLNGSVRVGLIIKALFWTGLWVSELISIRFTDLQVGEDYVTLSIVGKRNKLNRAYMPLELYKHILELFQGKRYLIETKSNCRYDRTTVTRLIKAKTAQFGLSLSAHEIGRHSRAMHLKGLGLSADKIAKALNHSSAKTTLDCYFHGEPTPEEMGI